MSSPSVFVDMSGGLSKELGAFLCEAACCKCCPCPGELTAEEDQSWHRQAPQHEEQGQVTSQGVTCLLSGFSRREQGKVFR